MGQIIGREQDLSMDLRTGAICGAGSGRGRGGGLRI